MRIPEKGQRTVDKVLWQILSLDERQPGSDRGCGQRELVP